MYIVTQEVDSLLLYIVAKYHFFRYVSWKDVIKYLQNSESCTLLWDTVYGEIENLLPDIKIIKGNVVNGYY